MKIGITLSELAQILHAKIEGGEGKEQMVMDHICSFEKAQGNDVCFILEADKSPLFAPPSIFQIHQSKAFCFVAQRCYQKDRPHLIVSDVLEALFKLQHYLFSSPFHAHFSPTWPYAYVSEKAVVDPTAILQTGVRIEKEAVIERDVLIESNAHIGHSSIIGEKTVIHAGAVIYPYTTIGKNCIIHAGAVIGAEGYGYKLSAQGWRKIPHIGKVTIGNRVEVGPHSSIERATFDETYIGDGTKIGAGAYIAHNVQIQAHSLLLAHATVGGSASLHEGSILGALVAVKDHAVIGKGARVVSCSGVMQDVPAGKTYAGIPAQPFFEWKRSIIARNQRAKSIKPAHLPSLLQRCKNWLISFFK